MLIDSHCHLTDDRYEDDLWEVLARALEAGVERIVTVCSDATDTLRIGGLLDEAEGRRGVPRVWGTAGIHPHEAQEAGPGDLDTVRGVLEGDRRFVAIGETGLDFYYDHSPREIQESLFRHHLELASALDLPVVVHSRQADALTGRILQEWAGRVRGVLHCFTGGADLLQRALELGWMISFTGIITFSKYGSQELVRSVPRDRLMVETDGPYLAPTPHRGRRNEPAYVARVAAELAAIRGEDPQKVQGYTTENAIRFFGLGE
ncbi:MAG: TatD family hydrolase [Longimicrobiales bacterium]